MRIISTSVAICLALTSGVSCARGDDHVARSASSAAPPSTIAPAVNDLERALADAGVERAGMPERLLELSDREFCGSDEFDQSAAVGSSSARCFLDRHIAELDAVYVSTGPTVEGDPITSVYVTGGRGKVATFVDSTRDAFGSGEWARWDGDRLAVPQPTFGALVSGLLNGVANELSAPLPSRVDGTMPTWFVDRTNLRWCGMEMQPQDRAFEARECFRKAVETGEPAEYTVGQSGDEGERRVSWYRVLGPGSFEVMERQLPGSPPSDQVPASWRRLRCDQIGFRSEPGLDADMVPFVDGSAGCVEQ